MDPPLSAKTRRSRSKLPAEDAQKPPLAERPLTPRRGARPAERVPVILESEASDGYRLIDSGMGEKLEQYGPYRIVRPEAQALWQRTLQFPAGWGWDAPCISTRLL